MKKVLILLLVLMLLTGCKQSKMQQVISRSEKAINMMINDEISMKELEDKLDKISSFCDAYKNENEIYETSLCINVSLYSYEASMSSVEERIDYKYWDKALKELKEYKKEIR